MLRSNRVRLRWVEGARPDIRIAAVRDGYWRVEWSLARDGWIATHEALLGGFIAFGVCPTRRAMMRRVEEHEALS